MAPNVILSGTEAGHGDVELATTRAAATTTAWEDNPANPYNWSLRKRLYHTSICASYAFTMYVHLSLGLGCVPEFSLTVRYDTLSTARSCRPSTPRAIDKSWRNTTSLQACLYWACRCSVSAWPLAPSSPPR